MKWIATSDLPTKNAYGYEDRRVGEWFIAANNIKQFKQEWNGVINGVEDVLNPSHNIAAYTNILWVHTLKNDWDLATVQMHYMEKDLSPFILEESTEAASQGFPLMIDATHCLDSTYVYAYTSAPCDGSIQQQFVHDSEGRIKNLYRRTCIDPYFKWSDETIPQSNWQYPLQDSCTLKNNSFVLDSGYIKMADNKDMVLVFGVNEDFYGNTGLILEKLNATAKYQRWHHLNAV